MLEPEKLLEDLGLDRMNDEQAIYEIQRLVETTYPNMSHRYYTQRIGAMAAARVAAVRLS